MGRLTWKALPHGRTTGHLSGAGSEPGRGNSSEEPVLIGLATISRSWDGCHWGCQVWWRPRGLELGCSMRWHSGLSFSAGRADGGRQPGRRLCSLSSERPWCARTWGQQEWNRPQSLVQFNFQTCSGLPQSLQDHTFVSSLFLPKAPAVQSRVLSPLVSQSSGHEDGTGAWYWTEFQLQRQEGAGPTPGKPACLQVLNYTRIAWPCSQPASKKILNLRNTERNKNPGYFKTPLCAVCIMWTFTCSRGKR